MKGNELIILRTENENLEAEVRRLKKKVNEMEEARSKTWVEMQELMDKFPGMKERVTKGVKDRLREEGMNAETVEEAFKYLRENMGVTDARTFPVHSWSQYRREGWEGCPPVVPWDMLSPFETQAIDNHGQTLDELAERGGLCPTEMYAIMKGMRSSGVRTVLLGEAIKFVNKKVTEHEECNNDRK